MKHCKKCSQDKDLSEFSKLKAAKDGLNYICRVCQRSANNKLWQAYYTDNKEWLLSAQREKQRKRTRLLAELKSKPCADCKQSYPYYVMDFDHVKGEKEFVMAKCGNLAWSRVLSEVEKCDVVCANCHRARTFLRRLERDSK